MTTAELFQVLKVVCNEMCECGTKHTAPMFHRDDCPYQEYATRRLEEHREGVGK